MKKTLISFAAALVSCFCIHAHAELFKCKDASGKTKYQEIPCASGEQKTVRAFAAAADEGSGGGAKQAKATGDDLDKRIPLDRTASKETVEACVKHYRPDLLETLSGFNVSSSMAQRLWMKSGVPAQRVLVIVHLSEKNKLGPGERATFTCVLSGDTIDAKATRELQSGD